MGLRTGRAAGKDHRAPAPCRDPNFPILASLRSALPFGRKRTSRGAIDIKRSARSPSKHPSTAGHRQSGRSGCRLIAARGPLELQRLRSVLRRSAPSPSSRLALEPDVTEGRPHLPDTLTAMYTTQTNIITTQTPNITTVTVVNVTGSMIFPLSITVCYIKLVKQLPFGKTDRKITPALFARPVRREGCGANAQACRQHVAPLLARSQCATEGNLPNPVAHNATAGL